MEHFDHEKYNNQNPCLRFLINRFTNNLINLIDMTAANCILDAGCGEGYIIKQITKERKSLKIEGFDYNGELVEFARKINPGINLTVQDIYSLPDFKNNSYSLVMCMQVLEHLDNPKKALSELFRISDKYVILSVPNEPYFRLCNFLRGRYIKTLGNKPNHLNIWTHNQFLEFLKDNGFNIKKVLTPFPWLQVLCEKN